MPRMLGFKHVAGGVACDSAGAFDKLASVKALPYSSAYHKQPEDPGKVLQQSNSYQNNLVLKHHLLSIRDISSAMFLGFPDMHAFLAPCSSSKKDKVQRGRGHCRPTPT